MAKKYINTLDYYGYGENNKMDSAKSSPYKVKVSDKEGNIITIEKDDSLYACVRLSFDNNSGILQLLDAAHDNSVLAEVEMPNADYIYNCRFDEGKNAILFDVKALYGDETSTIELDVESLVELYEAGNGIEIGEKNQETGRKPISIKLAEGENILQVSESGLSISDSVTTDDELAAAISGKADVEYVDELFSELSGLTSGITEILELIEEYGYDIEKIKEILGTDESDPSIDERLNDKADRDELIEIDEEIGELSGDVVSIKDEIESLSDKLDTEIEERKTDSVSSVEYISSAKTINFKNSNDEILSTIDTTDFIKDGMVDNVEIKEIDGVKVLAITFNTDAGKEEIDIPLDDIFNPGDYYTKREVDDLIAAEKTSRRNADLDLWAALDTEKNERRRADQTEKEEREIADDEIRAMIVPEEVIDEKIENAISDIEDAISDIEDEISEEKARAINAETLLDNKIDLETQRAINAETELRVDITAEAQRASNAESELSIAITTETQRATSKENSIANDLLEEVSNRQNADSVLQSSINALDSRITGFENALADETQARQDADASIEDDIADIRRTFVSKEYVDRKDSETLQTAINASVLSAKTYTDYKVDGLEVELKHYCDSGHTELQKGISENSTKINVISNLYGVSGDDASNYDDSGNGILDVLHREFHEFKNNYVDLSDQVSANTSNIEIISGIVDTKADKNEVYTKEETDELLDEKLDVSAYTDISEQVTANTQNIAILSGAVQDEEARAISAETELYNAISGASGALDALIEKLGYTDNETLNRTGEREVAFGQYNISVDSDDPSEKTLFSIGNGTDDENRNNALEVKQNGDVYLWVEGEFMNINKLLGQIAHEVYDADSSSHFFDGD